MNKPIKLITVIIFLLICLPFLSISEEANYTGSSTRNLNNILYVDRSDWGITFSVNKDNSVTVTGGPPTENAYLFSGSWSVYNRFELPAGVYTLSGGISQNAFIYLTFYNDQTSLEFARDPVYDYGSSMTFTTDKKYYCAIQISIVKNEPVDGVTFFPQIEAGPVATEYSSPWNGSYQIGLLTNIQNDLLNLQNKLDEKVSIPRHLTVPEYYFNSGYIEKKCDRINEIARSCTSASDSFVFITDIHWTMNAGSSPALLKYLRDHTRVDKMFCGGDICDFVSSEHQPYDAFTQFYDAWQAPIYTAMGNHEYLSEYGTEGRLYYSYNSIGMNRIGNLKRNYFYVDNPQSMIRYIVLNPFAPGNLYSGYEEEQLKWLTLYALDLEPGWGAIVITHMTHDINNGVMTKTDFSYKMLNILDRYAGNGEIIAVLSGHTHADYLDYTEGGIPILITTCDKNRPWTEKGANQEPWLDNRISGTINEQAFDVYIIDREKKEITRVRIGEKIHYGTDPDAWETYEEVTVSYIR